MKSGLTAAGILTAVLALGSFLKPHLVGTPRETGEPPATVQTASPLPLHAPNLERPVR